VRKAIDNDLDAPRALEALDDLASAILSVDSTDPAIDKTAPTILKELGHLMGINLDRPLE
jgi:cysteinyl-tRNA synthetase